MDVKFGGFYSPNPDQQDEIMYMVIGVEDGWYYLNKEQFKSYYDYINGSQTNYVLDKNK